LLLDSLQFRRNLAACGAFACRRAIASLFETPLTLTQGACRKRSLHPAA